jgi:hypothetical protein
VRFNFSVRVQGSLQKTIIRFRLEFDFSFLGLSLGFS